MPLSNPGVIVIDVGQSKTDVRRSADIIEAA
jgi:hypothetical protein